MTTAAESTIATVDNLAERKAKMIPFSQIDMSKPGPEHAFTKKTAMEIADSIKAKGLLHPILLRPKEKPVGDIIYDIVAGRHRSYATCKILGWESIPAHVVKMDDEDLVIYSIIENVRKQLPQDQFYAQIARWRKLHSEKSKAQKSEAGKASAAARAAKANGQAPPAKAAAAPVDKPDEGTDIQKLVASATGASLSTAKREIKIAAAMDNLTEEEKAVVFPEDEADKPEKKHLTVLAGLTKKSASDVIKLKASGMSWDEALKHGERRAPRSEKPADPTKKSEADMTDEEYLDATCATKLQQLKKKSVFKGEVSLYRSWARMRRRLQKDVEALLRESKASNRRGPLHVLLERVFRVSHPNAWLTCGACAGTGKKKESDEACGACNGAGYKLIHEAL